MLKACARMGESEKVESWVEKMFEAMPMDLVGQAILFAVCSLSMHLIPHSSDIALDRLVSSLRQGLS